MRFFKYIFERLGKKFRSHDSPRAKERLCSSINEGSTFAPDTFAFIEETPSQVGLTPPPDIPGIESPLSAMLGMGTSLEYGLSEPIVSLGWVRGDFKKPMLVICNDLGHPTKFPLRDGNTTLGRDSRNDIRINDKTVSPDHATFTFNARLGTLSVTDNKSVNGVIVNGKRIRVSDGSVELKPYDQIVIGLNEFTVDEAIANEAG